MDEERDQPMEHRQEPEAGARGGSAAFAAAQPSEAFAAWAKTVVRWGPVWVGLLVALAINLVLYILVFAVALSSADLAAGPVRETLTAAGIWTAVSTLVALFVGGFLAGRLGWQSGLRSPVLQATMVWALYVIIGLMLSVFGLGGLASGLTGMADARAMVAGADVSMAEAQRMVSGAAEGMWWAFGGLVVAWLAAILGGFLGAKSAEPGTDATRTAF